MQTIGRSYDAAGNRALGRFSKLMSFVLGAVIGSPTGGDMGAGVLNATEIALNGYKILNESFRPSSQPTPNMTVAIAKGTLQLGTTLVAVAAQNSAALVAPAANPRNDIIYIDGSTGVIGIAAGAEAASPVDPALPAGKIAMARVRLATSTTSITAAILDDLRSSTGSLSSYQNRSTAGNFGASNNGAIVNITGAGGITLTFDAIATLPIGWSITFCNKSSDNVTLDPSGAETLDGLATRAMEPNNRVTIYYDGTSLKTFSGFYTKSSTPSVLNGALVTTAHGFPRRPTRIRSTMINVTTDGGWAPNDVCELYGTYETSATTVVGADATNFIMMGSSTFQMGRKDTGAFFALGETKWNMQAIAYDEY